MRSRAPMLDIRAHTPQSLAFPGGWLPCDWDPVTSEPMTPAQV